MGIIDCQQLINLGLRYDTKNSVLWTRLKIVLECKETNSNSDSVQWFTITFCSEIYISFAIEHHVISRPSGQRAFCGIVAQHLLGDSRAFHTHYWRINIGSYQLILSSRFVAQWSDHHMYTHLITLGNPLFHLVMLLVSSSTLFVGLVLTLNF